MVEEKEVGPCGPTAEGEGGGWRMADWEGGR